MGTATLTFSDGNNGTFAYTVNGISQTKSITRQVFGALPTCTWGALANLALATNYTDLWWAVGGVESGWGINFTHQGDVIFATWFTYDFDGAALPMSATLTKVGPGIYSGSLIKTSGPAFSAVPFDPNAVTRTRGRHGHGDVHQRQCRDLLLQVNDGGKTDHADQVDHAAGVPRAGHRLPVMACAARALRGVAAGSRISSAATTLRPSAARMLNVRHAAGVSITSRPTRASVSARVRRGCGKRIAAPVPNSTTSGL